MKITFIAQSGIMVELNSGIRFCIALWLKNPINEMSISDVPKMDFVFITHDHPDHDLKSGIEIAKRDNAAFISSTEIAAFAADQGVQDTDEGYCGGTVDIKGLKVTHTLAPHNSDTGIPIGFIITTEEGTLYHMGDTAYFSELEMYGKLYDIDILFVPIGSRYTMDALQASYAVEDIKPKITIPIHYNTFPAIQQDPKILEKLIKEKSIKTDIRILKPGDTTTI